jgi:hypothetical protein
MCQLRTKAVGVGRIRAGGKAPVAAIDEQNRHEGDHNRCVISGAFAGTFAVAGNSEPWMLRW